MAARRIPVLPMLATLGTPADVGDSDWSLEMKWDGIRAICEVSSDGVRLWSRNGNEITASFPEIVQALPQALPGRACVIDGEIVAFDEAARPSFGRLQSRLGLAPEAVPAALARVAAHLLAFDVLRVAGEPTISLPCVARRSMLEELVVANPVVLVPPAFDGDLVSAMASSAEHGLEGVVAKRPDSPYRPGRRTREWVKIKHSRMQEVIVVGWQEGAGRRTGTVGSLLLAVQDDEGMTYVGKVGTGFSDRDLDDMRSLFARMERGPVPVRGVPFSIAQSAHWITPSLVGEVQLTEWTTGGHLRHPVWRGWRPDKSVADVRKEL